MTTHIGGTVRVWLPLSAYALWHSSCGRRRTGTVDSTAACN
jgi:hypothetical protein